MKSFQPTVIEPKPTGGRWSPTKAYFALGERVELDCGYRGVVRGYALTCLPGVHPSRVNYLILRDGDAPDAPLWNALLEDIKGGPWNRSHPQYSHNVEFAGVLARGGCAIPSCVICNH
jgi:hypothetical protein